MKKWLWIATILGCFGFSIVFPIFVLFSLRVYPGGFIFTEHYMSYLGGDAKNPEGFIFYNSGVIIAGISLILIMGGFKIWESSNKWDTLFLVLMRGVGLVEAISVIAVGIFPDRHPLHITFSGIYGVSNVALTLLIMVGMFFHPAYKKSISVYILGLLVLTAVFLFLEQYELMELFTIIGTCILVLLLLWNMWEIQKKST